MPDEIEVINNEVLITKQVMTEVVEKYTAGQLTDLIASYQAQIVNLQNLIVEKQTLLAMIQP